MVPADANHNREPGGERVNDSGAPGLPPAAPLPDVILVVEDDESTRYLVVRTLAAAGYRTIEASTGSEAMVGARSLPDAIVLDVELPDLHGYDVCRHLKADPLIRDIPVLQVSASFTDDQHRAGGLDAGAEAYLVHPYGPLELVATIRTLIRGRRAIDQSRRLLEKLEELVEERTAELAVKVKELAEQQALLKASNSELAATVQHLADKKAQLEASNAELETFVYTASHDLRTPLVSLRGMADLLPNAVESGDAGEARYLVDRIGINTDRMGSLLDGVLNLSRVGRLSSDHVPVEVGEVVAGVLEDAQARLEAPGLSLEVPESWPQVMAAKGEVYQVVTNLLGNALKFSGKADLPKQVRVSWTTEGPLVRLRVEDNGPGVPADYRTKIFELFQKLDPTTEGTGVGLAIVKRIAERHGGRAWVEDSPLGGAAFVVTLPQATTNL